MSTKRLLHGPCNKPPPGTQGHFFDIYVNSSQFPLPSPVPEMVNIDPLDFQKAKRAKQAQARQEQLQGAASAANRSPKGHSMAREESMAAESGVRQLSPVAQAAAASTDAETVYPNKKVSGLFFLDGNASQAYDNSALLRKLPQPLLMLRQYIQTKR